MLDFHNVFSSPSQTLIAQIEGIPTTDEFQNQIEQYEGDAIQYFALIMGITVVISFIKSLT